MTGEEKGFYRLARERAFDPERYARMDEGARKAAESRNEARREYHREYFRLHREQARTRHAGWIERLRADPERLERFLEKQRGYARRRYAANRERIINRSQGYYRAHREEINARTRELRREWTPERRELEKAKRHERYLRNREKIRARRKERLANMTPEERERYRERMHGYYVRYRDKARAERKERHGQPQEKTR